MEQIGKILPNVFRPQLSRLEPPVIEVLAPLWSRVVGKALACQCLPVAFSAGTLTVASDNAGWVQPLQQMAEEIRAAVNKFLGKPVVGHLRIVCTGKRDLRGKARRQTEELLVSTAKRKDWLGHVPGVPADRVRMIGQPYSKVSGRNRGKVH